LDSNAPAGWYHAETDPSDTERYWDGSMWTADTRPVEPRTGPKTPDGRTLASGWARIGARLIDLVILLLISIPLAVIGTAETPEGIVTTSGTALLQALVGAAYEIGFVAFLGATPGKMAVGLEIVRQRDGVSPPGLGTAAIRWAPVVLGGLIPILGLVVFLAFLASLVLVFVDSMHRSAFDFVGQTYVVQKRNE
jgi:uncharacterized RDD family membrane protein YckC